MHAAGGPGLVLPCIVGFVVMALVLLRVPVSILLVSWLPQRAAAGFFCGLW
jgi:uncharacterized membrane protein